MTGGDLEGSTATLVSKAIFDENPIAMRGERFLDTQFNVLPPEGMQVPDHFSLYLHYKNSYVEK